MGLDETPAALRLHIGFFGKRNGGKSSLVNAVTGQELSVVSCVKGTTTDPVYKTMELLPLGPVVIIDTPGIDDDDALLGAKRILKAGDALNKSDIAVCVVDAGAGMTEPDFELLSLIEKRGIPHIIVYNKSDLIEPEQLEDARVKALLALGEADVIFASALNGDNIEGIKKLLGSLAPKPANKRLIGDMLSPGDMVVLVTPIDESAPKGRLILPQQQTIRDILESRAAAVVVQDDGLAAALKGLASPPRMVITDSQVFKKAAADTPDTVLLTSFSILFARLKGFIKDAAAGADELDSLNDGDTVLISEGCTHHRQCGDIGTVKLPKLIKGYTGKKLCFEFTAGGSFPDELTKYSLVVHCGGCMLNDRAMSYRRQKAVEQGVPITNYGVAIAKMQGILQRSLEPFRGEL